MQFLHSQDEPPPQHRPLVDCTLCPKSWIPLELLACMKNRLVMVNLWRFSVLLHVCDLQEWIQDMVKRHDLKCKTILKT